MKELAAKEKAEARAKRREQRVDITHSIDSKAREEAIARGEEVPDMEPMEAEDAPADASNPVRLHLNDDGATLTDVPSLSPSHAVNQQQRRDSRSRRRPRRHSTSLLSPSTPRTLAASRWRRRSPTSSPTRA